MATYKKKYKRFGNLIKWPQCVIVGKKISVEQARDVLFRTDSFFSGFGSNQREWDEKMWEHIGYPSWRCSCNNEDNWIVNNDKRVGFYKRHKIIELEYLYNNYVSSCYIGGVYGWCHPNGDIRFWNNVGKYPEWYELETECRLIAKAFPFLDMKVCFYNQESDCEDYYDYKKECVGGFKIENGKTRFLKKSEYIDVNSEFCRQPYKSVEEHRNYIFNEKYEVFGDSFDKDVYLRSCSELFFSESEFKRYFKDCYCK